MARILFAFLGAAAYHPACYEFGNDARARHHTRFLPQALVAELARRDPSRKFDRVVLCGTATSGWRELIEALTKQGFKYAQPTPGMPGQRSELVLSPGPRTSIVCDLLWRVNWQSNQGRITDLKVLYGGICF